MKNSSNVKLPGKVFIFIYTVCISKKTCCLESIVSNHAVFSNKNITIIVSGGQYPSNQFLLSALIYCIYYCSAILWAHVRLRDVDETADGGSGGL